MKVKLLKQSLTITSLIVAMWALAPGLGHALPLVAQTTYGGSGDETGTAIAAGGSGVYFSGHAGGGNEGVVGQFNANLGSTPVWSRTWPGVSGGDGFNGVGVINNSVYAAGWSYTSWGHHGSSIRASIGSLGQ